jgi:hypothetical protein
VQQDNAEWTKDAFRHFVADFLIAFLNVTMQDAFMRLLMPLLIIVAVFKIAEVLLNGLIVYSDARSLKSVLIDDHLYLPG